MFKFSFFIDWPEHRLGLLWHWIVCLRNKQKSFCRFEIASKYCISDSFVGYESYSISSKWFLPMVVEIKVIWVKLPIPVHFSSLILNVDIHSCHLLFDHFQSAWIHGPNIPFLYAILSFTALDFTSNTSRIHNRALFLLGLHLFILSGVIPPLFSSSILGTHQHGEFIFHCHIVLPFHTVHGVLKARILKWFAIPFSRGPHSVRPLHMTWPSWVVPHSMA